MPGLVDLRELIRFMSPKLNDGTFVFCCLPYGQIDEMKLSPVATINEPEGTTVVLDVSVAQAAGLEFHGTFKQITLMVHSSLEAVGLTAVVAERLASEGISANVFAGFYHDHIFVPEDKAQLAMTALQALRDEA
ncbi:MAG: ACT domain-containing protein [Gammaproteobacteria bacterium]|nr:MAG: ACT domain-containing protein [Gammaproteobacteria bacterium]